VKRPALLAAVVGLACSGLASVSTAEERIEVQTIDLTSGEFRLVTEPCGTRIEMDGFGHLMAPGRPMLPARNFSVLLPPGARVLSLDVQETGARDVPGTHRIVATPLLVPLTHSPEVMEEMRREWNRNHDEVFGSNRAYPPVVARITGSGTLRKYSYVSISFCPFTYRAASGRLTHHESVRARIRFALPDPAGPEGQAVARLLRDTVADDRAEGLFVNYAQMASLYEPSGSPSPPNPDTHDYVIIARDDMVSAVTSSDFVSWKTGLGHDVRIVLSNGPEIGDQPGGDFAERIRNFLRASYGPWGIEYVLLIGNYARVPMRYCFADPTNHAHNPSNPSNPGGSVPTDYYYADLSFPDDVSWDSDGDGYYGEYGQDTPDFLAEISVGRIPTNNLTKITYALDKLVQFEQDTGAWKNCALHGAAILFYENQDYMGIPFRDGADCLNLIETGFMRGWPMARYCEHEGLSPSTYPWLALTQASFTSEWRNGKYGIVNWAGHGSPNGAWRVIWDWDDGDGVPETDGSDGFSHEAFVADWVSLEDDHPSIVFAVSCNVGYPEPNAQGRLGVDLLTLPSFGASAGVVSSSRVAAVSADWPTSPGGAESICCEFNRYLIAGPSGAGRVGDALYDAKHYCHVNYGWDHYFEYWNLYDYNLYGDPALVWEGVSSAVDVSSLDTFVERGTSPANFPNPFGPGTRIEYDLAADGRVRLEIFDVHGRTVAELVNEHQKVGSKSVPWDGRNREGAECPSGIYFFRLQAGERTVSRSMVLLR
jgi:hypothetical protein